MLSLQEKVNRLSIIGVEWMGAEVQYVIQNNYEYLPEIEDMTDDDFEKFISDLAPRMPTVIDKSLEVVKSGSKLLREHERISSRAMAVGRKIKDDADAAYAIEDPKLRFEALAKVDERANKFLVNCRTRSTEMKEARSAVTQVCSRIVTMFTELENPLDNKTGPIPKSIQEFRNRYAKDLVVEQERIKKEAKLAADKKIEAVDLRAWVKNAIGQALVNYKAARKLAWTESFNAITLDNYEDKKVKMDAVNTAFPAAKLRELIIMKPPYPVIKYLTPEENNAIINEEWDVYDFFTFYTEYGQEMSDLKKDLQDKLPSKLAELQEAKRISDKAEEDRLALIESNRIAEENRQAALLKAKGEKEKERLRRLGIQQRWDERKRLNKIQADADKEAARLLKEKETREQEQAQQLKSEQEAAQTKISSAAELGRQAGHTATLFEEMSATASSGNAPSAKNGFEIKVKSPAGWVEIFGFWMQREGMMLMPDDLEKKSLGQMKKAVEAIAAKAQKNGKIDQIVSEHLIYETKITARNVREKDEKTA